MEKTKASETWTRFELYKKEKKKESKGTEEDKTKKEVRRAYYLSDGEPLGQWSPASLVCIATTDDGKRVALKFSMKSPRNNSYEHVRSIILHEKRIFEQYVKTDPQPFLIPYDDAGEGELRESVPKKWEPFSDTQTGTCVATEYLGQKNLVEIINEEKKAGKKIYSPAKRLDIFKSILRAALHFKKKQLLYCDWKLDNILIQKEGGTEIVMIDFGTTCVITRGNEAYEGPGALQREDIISPLFTDGSMRRTYFRAPELWQSQLNHSEKSEVFALGVIFFILIAGKTPFAEPLMSDRYYNLLCRTPEAYWKWAEYSNKPLPSSGLTAEETIRKCEFSESQKSALARSFSFDPRERISLIEFNDILNGK